MNSTKIQGTYHSDKQNQDVNYRLNASLTLNNNSQRGNTISLLSNNVGIYDTIRLTLEGVFDSDLVDRHTWKIVSAHTEDEITNGHIGTIQKVILLDGQGNEVEKGAHFTTMSIKLVRGDRRLVIDIPSPATLMGSPLIPLSTDLLQPFIERVQDIVHRYVTIDVLDCNVSRLDSSTIWQMEHPVRMYIGMLSCISPNKRNRSDKKVYDNESIQYRNASTGYGFYDKVEQLSDKFNIPEGLNILRCEEQNKKIITVKGKFGSLKFRDITNEAVIKIAVGQRLKSYDKYFIKETEGLTRFETMYAFEQIINEGKERGLAFRLLAALAIRENLCPIDEIQAILMGTLTGRQLRNIVKEYRRLQSIIITGNDLHNEIRGRLLNDLKMVS